MWREGEGKGEREGGRERKRGGGGGRERERERELAHLPLLHQGPEFICSHGHAMEVGEDILALYIFRDQSELPEGLLVILQVSQRYLKHTSLQAITGEFLGVTQGDNRRCIVGCLLFPCVLVTRVLPTFLTANTAGAFTSYQSFFVKGSILWVLWTRY